MWDEKEGKGRGLRPLLSISTLSSPFGFLSEHGTDYIIEFLAIGQILRKESGSDRSKRSPLKGPMKPGRNVLRQSACFARKPSALVRRAQSALLGF